MVFQSLFDNWKKYRWRALNSSKIYYMIELYYFHHKDEASRTIESFLYEIQRISLWDDSKAVNQGPFNVTGWKIRFLKIGASGEPVLGRSEPSSCYVGAFRYAGYVEWPLSEIREAGNGRKWIAGGNICRWVISKECFKIKRKNPDDHVPFDL